MGLVRVNFEIISRISTAFSNLSPAITVGSPYPSPNTTTSLLNVTSPTILFG